MFNTIQLTQLAPEDLKQIMREAVRDEMKDFIQQQEAEPYVTIQEGADILKVTKPTMYEYKRQGLIKFLKIGNRTLIKRADIINALTLLP